MEIKATLAPGQNGTKRLLKQYGDHSSASAIAMTRRAKND